MHQVREQMTLGQTYTGYKGGEYQMRASTRLWVAPWGEAHNTAVVGIVRWPQAVIIETAWEPW
jgi:hypothetical protein